MFPRPTLPLLLLLLLAAAGCGNTRSGEATPDSAVPGSADAALSASRVLSVEGFSIPESVRHDPAQDVYFVSNVGEGATARDNNGYISRVRPDGVVEDLRFIAGGKNGAVLHAPKGLFVVADTLWVTDIDVVRAFDVRTGAPLQSVDLAPLGARFLNDVTRAPDGSLYVTDTGLEFHTDGRVTHPGPDRVYRVGPGRRGSIAVEADTLRLPNGVTWDDTHSRLIIVSLDSRSIFEWRPGQQRPTHMMSGPGDLDGVEMLEGGRFLISSKADSAVHVVSDSTTTPIARGLPNVGDIGLDRTRQRILVPLLDAGRVEIWQLNRS